MCPFDPFDNTTAVYSMQGNPENLPAFYSAANADYTKSIPTIFRSRIFYQNGTLAYEYLTTAKKDPKWLNEPQFVGSFEMEEVVYFFFREEALEHSHSCGKKVYSRVARVCKNDKGGPNVVKNQWTSYQKARLNCSIPGKVQYYFDEIQDIQWDASSRTFYALFTTSSYGVTGSAICVYTQDDIEQAFSGPFQYTSNGTQVPTASEPNPRPGDCAGIPDSTRVKNDFVTFVKEKTLMYYAVQHKFGEPIFMKPNVMLQKLQTHIFSSYNVFFAGSNEGQVYQIYQPTANLSETLISAVISPVRSSGPVWSLQYDKNTLMLYVGYDSSVVQFDMKKLCKKYTKADSCVFNPFCGWYNGECFHQNCTSYQMSITYCKLAQQLHKDPTNPKRVWETLLQIFVDEKLPDQKHINLGGLVTLDIRMPLCTSGPVSWHFGRSCNDTLTKVPKNVHILGADNSLTIRNTSMANQGCYSAKDENGRDLAFYMLHVQTGELEKEDLWTRKFYEWCDEFERYKNRINVWQHTCSGDHSNTIPNLPGE
ncbi:semaphorin-2A-like [Liolophura sinensis]|uniref:semaphorin-2A-like n=1 Tax=Liolophura sinensis TaxID=3198878 RepID=UPI003158F975